MILELEREIDNLDYNLHTISIRDILERMGFPENWEQIKSIERSFVDEE